MSHQPIRLVNDLFLEDPNRLDSNSTHRTNNNLKNTLSEESLKKHNETHQGRNPTILEQLQLRVEVPSPRKVRFKEPLEDNRQHSEDDNTSSDGESGFVFCLTPTNGEFDGEESCWDEFGPMTPPTAHQGKTPVDLRRIRSNVTMIIRDEDEDEEDDDSPSAIPRLSMLPIQISHGPEEEETFLSGEDSSPLTPHPMLLSRTPLKKQEPAASHTKQESSVPFRLHDAANPRIEPSAKADEDFSAHVRYRFQSMLSFLDEKIEAQKNVLVAVRTS